ncbi:MAG: Hsp20/alpha crystallin family protein [Candidatus Peribacteraceae bacterium]|nr:Hsp20/alpha crystallin family protein [Candidatus Peribacteraceae bacterium]MDD5742524.1 Hsp20/alpha crystallin family protein [Candidatus Peribacteraceae bacterium]
MASSPFHGIFSSLGSPEWDQKAAAATAVKLTTEESAPSRQSGIGQIAVDIYEQDSYYIVRAPLAGVKLGDLDIEVDEKVLTIRGRRSVPDAVARDQYYLQECFWGEFSRSITLPCVIDPKRVKATFNRDSILKILVPKEEKVKVIRISEGG